MDGGMDGGWTVGWTVGWMVGWTVGWNGMVTEGGRDVHGKKVKNERFTV